MKKLLLALTFSLFASSAWAQCNGIFPANTLCGNLSGSPKPPAAFTASGTVVGPGSSTLNGLPLWANTAGTQLKDGAGLTIAGNYTWGGNQTFNGAATVTGIAAGAAGEVQMSTASGGLADSTIAVVTPSFSSTGVWTQIPSFIPNGFAEFVLFGREITLNTLPSPSFTHEFGGCYLCTINPSSAGSTFLVGNDGSNPSTLGGASSGGFHMTALGSSVVCQADNAICIGHGVNVTGTASTVIAGTDTSTSSGVNTVIGGTATGTTTNSTIINGGTISGAGNFDIMIGTQSTCSIAGLTNVIAIGQFAGGSACPTATGQVALGGTQAIGIYAGGVSSGATIPFIGAGIFSTGSAPTLTLGTCTGSSWTGGSYAATFVSSACAVGNSYQFQWASNLATNPAHGQICFLQDMTTPAVTIAQTTANTNAPTFKVTGSTAVVNNDVVTISCQGY